MNQPLGGPGLGLPQPTNLYPSELFNAGYDFATNQVVLAPGENLVIPPGDWMVSMGGYLVFQYKDPITGTWVFSPGAAYDRGNQFITSDGQNVRVANLTGCPCEAVVTSTGATYVQGSTTVTVTGGGASTWAPIIGGALAVATSISQSGAGYGVAPLALIPAPAPFQTNPNGVGGIPASGYVAISSGTLVNSGFTFINQGAGYAAAPANIALLPTPTDPNLATGITLGTVGFSLTSASLLMAVLNTNNGSPVTAITLTIGGVGVTASATAVIMQTITAASISGAGTLFNTSQAPLLTSGGVPPQGTVNPSPYFNYLAWFPRPVNISFATGTVAQPGIVYDGGLFLSRPVPAVAPVSGTGGTVATATLSMGSVADIVWMQPYS